MNDYGRLGLGLDYGIVRLVEARQDWAEVARRLARDIRQELPDDVVAVEHIGSTAVPGLLTKPIIDLAVGLGRAPQIDRVRDRLEVLGWEYRGDAGEEGGLVFVLSDRPLHRIAHAHTVDHEGRQWRNYLSLRNLLSCNPLARATYETTKKSLLDRFPQDRKAYTDGKGAIVRSLLQA